MWLKALHWLLDRLVPTAEEPQAAAARLQSDGGELRKTEAVPWHYPPY
jgi:hypothetical protein